MDGSCGSQNLKKSSYVICSVLLGLCTFCGILQYFNIKHFRKEVPAFCNVDVVFHVWYISNLNLWDITLKFGTFMFPCLIVCICRIICRICSYGCEYGVSWYRSSHACQIFQDFTPIEGKLNIYFARPPCCSSHSAQNYHNMLHIAYAALPHKISWPHIKCLWYGFHLRLLHGGYDGFRIRDWRRADMGFACGGTGLQRDRVWWKCWLAPG
jgi:hypothetical protein